VGLTTLSRKNHIVTNSIQQRKKAGPPVRIRGLGEGRSHLPHQNNDHQTVSSSIKPRRKSNKFKKFSWKFATWNVLSLGRAGALHQVKEVALKYSIKLMALQEIKWLHSGTMDTRNFSLMYSCGAKREFGTGFLIHQSIRKDIIAFKPINERMCWIRMKCRFFNVTFICIHAPTEEKTEEEKEAFYNKLEEIWEAIPTRDVKIILGDANAKVGKKKHL
jgi:hypothetical protein